MGPWDHITSCGKVKLCFPSEAPSLPASTCGQLGLWGHHLVLKTSPSSKAMAHAWKGRCSLEFCLTAACKRRMEGGSALKSAAGPAGSRAVPCLCLSCSALWSSGEEAVTYSAGCWLNRGASPAFPCGCRSPRRGDQAHLPLDRSPPMSMRCARRPTRSASALRQAG